MLVLLLTLAGWAADVSLPTVDALMAMPSTPERVASLRAVLDGGTTDGETLAKAATAIQVLEKLDAAGRTDPAVVRGFLEAALSDEAERRDDAVEVAATGLPPGPRPPVEMATASVVVAVERPADLEKLRAYRQRRLYKDTREVVQGTTTAGYGAVGSYANWTVFQDSQAFGARGFALEVGDTEKVAYLRRRDQIAAGWAIGLGVAGIAAAAGGLAMAGDDDAANDPVAFALVVSSPVLVGVSIGLPLGVSQRRKWVAHSYAPEEAQRWIDQYNDALRTELGLTADDVRAVELAP
jgi:hypothetical protein